MFKKMIVVAAMALLAISAQVGTASASLANGGFETGDFSGWSVDAGSNWAMVIDTGAYAGTYHAELGTYGTAGTITHDAFATTAGQQYTVSFALSNDSKDTTNVFQALWNGQIQALNPVLDATQSTPYTLYKFTATADTTSSSLAFNFQNDQSVFHLDNVDATPTPIPAAFWLLGSGLAGLAGLRRKMA